uniref:Transmembrane protein 26-like n=1 Tax=Saccoglossus kowalevskii TaxID=10224 RepID=A0ABM0GKT2_SACKO|nr:PREDICTED: transmembrane protein 26-like [Saccoglossus kowalevskii]
MPSVGVILKGIFARIFYVIHGLLCVWRLTDVNGNMYFWAVIVPVLLLPLEMVITMMVNKTKGEWKWVCPSIFLFLCCSVTSIYLMEVELMEDRIEYRDDNNLQSCDIEESDLYANQSELLDIQGVTIPIAFTSDYWVLTLEQMLLCIVIIGRWFLPKGSLTREQLSSLLLTYIGIAADILEFLLEGLKEPQVKCDRFVVYCILSLWAISMAQFAVVRTASNTEKKGGDEKKRQCCTCCNSEVRGIMISSLMQDLPFLVMRLTLLLYYKVVNHMMVFFTCKNILMLMLQSYRFVVIIFEEQGDPNDVVPLGKIQVDDPAKFIPEASDFKGNPGVQDTVHKNDRIP